VSSEDAIAAELERRLKAQHEPAKVEKRSYSPAPTSGPVSLHPTEKALRDAVWQWLRSKSGVALVALVVGGSSGFAGSGAQEAAQSEAMKAAQADLARARNELQEATAAVERLSAKVTKLTGEVEDLGGAQKSLGEKHGRLREQVEKLEEARTIVVKAEPDRAPKP
jgi:uncharacterized protein HemX